MKFCKTLVYTEDSNRTTQHLGVLSTANSFYFLFNLLPRDHAQNLVIGTRILGAVHLYMEYCVCKMLN